LLFATTLSLFPNLLIAQEITRTFSKELSVAPESHIISNGPRYMAFESNGRMSSSLVDKEFTLVPGGNDDIPALLIKEYQIFTWELNKIRQIVEIKILPDEDAPEEAQQLMDKLQIRLTLHADGSIPIDDNLNIAKFGFVNGFFKRNTNTVTLENGKKYRVKSLIISSQLTIPSNARLSLKVKYISVSLGDLKGSLHLISESGSLRAGNINKLDAILNFTQLSVLDIDSARVNVHNSSFAAKNIRSLVVGSNELTMNDEAKKALFYDKRKSTASTYTFESVTRLRIQETVNDKFFLGALGSLVSHHSTFSDYQIASLKDRLDLRAKNGDLRIEELASGFNSVKIENNVSTITIGLGKTKDYQLEIFQNKYTEYQFNEELSSIKDFPQNPYLKGNKDKAGKIVLGCESCKIILKD